MNHFINKKIPKREVIEKDDTKNIRKDIKHGGFTIIETLVAVAILMISIAGPLTIAHKGLLAAIYAHDNVTASYLAQDTMEYLKNVRDYNILRGTEANGITWLSGLPSCITTDSSPRYCRLDTITNDTRSYASAFDAYSKDLCLGSSGACRLYKSNAGYDHNSSGTKTQFSRYFYIIEKLQDEKAVIVVNVEWNNGTVSNIVSYKNEIFRVLR
ncbi:MAG TPA: prepilin-type N-terminal cleavage/methylation domain-containing protein [Candidatus Paceibacterota bacterium]